MPPDIDNMPAVPALSATSDTPAAAEETPVVPAPEAASETPAVETPAAEGAEGEGGEEGAPETPAAAPQRGNKFGERLSQMAADRRAAEDGKRAADARADKLADSLEKAVDALARQQARPAAEEQPDPRPSREAFADPDAYDSALIEWSSRTATKLAAAEFDRREAENREKTQLEQQEQQVRQQHEAAATRWGESRAKLLDDPQYHDFAEVAENPDLNIPMTMVPALLAAENGPQVLYHLGKNPTEAARIAALDPMRAAIEIGRISATLEQGTRPPVRKPIPAVEPVGARNNAGPKDPNDMTTEEWAAQRMPQLQGERRAGMWGRPTH